MDELIKNIKMNNLFDIYGSLLTERQANIFKLYYFDDLSLSEIAESENVSRNAIYDSLKKSEVIMEEYEDKLHLLNLNKSLKEIISSYQDNDNQEIKEIIVKLESMVK